ncbi:translocation protein TolB [Anaerobacillus alkaliphilus]|nr:translocation protein TolB [Anaerobacillus alkaliphilus]
MKKLVFIFLLSILLTIPIHPIVEATSSINVAFVRENDLWLKVGQHEKQITNGEFIRNLKWSYDGGWLAFSKGKEEDELWVYQLENEEMFQIIDNTQAFQWSPKEHKLAFLTNGVLSVSDVNKKDETKIENVAKGVGNFSWQPHGRGFLISSVANLLPTGWTGVELFTVPVDAKLDPKRIKHFYTLPNESDEFFAVTTSPFKWSNDGSWISFIGMPTASLSMDMNTLCVIAADGKAFQQLGKMLYFDDWFKWSPRSNRLAFIEGEGRFAVKNKHLMMNEFPVHQGISLTPEGFVEKGFTWIDGVQIVVSRAKESEWSNDPTERPKPSLYHVNLLTHQQVELTSPGKQKGDYMPLYLTDLGKLAWVQSDETYFGNIYLSDIDGTNQELYVERVGDGNLYEDSFGWSKVISFYQ